jgi:hypothetical protein
MSIRTLATAVAGLSLLPAAIAVTASGPAFAATDVYLAAGLRGANEAGTLGDPDGQSTVVLKISGNQVSFAIRWDKVDVPNTAAVHIGAKGTTGEVKLDLIAGQLPKTALGVTGTTIADPGLIDALVTDPNGFYADLGNTTTASGAVRGQFNKLNRPVDLRGVLQGADQATISSAEGGWWLRPTAKTLAYTAMWSGIPAPVSGTIERPLVSAELFEDPDGLQPNLTGIAGEAQIDPGVLRQITAAPQNFEAVLRTVDRTSLRERLSGAPFRHPRSFVSEVLLGAQIYNCTALTGGTNAFTQFDVSAKLRRDITHSFVQPVAGPPQWVAPDHSAVRGTLVTKTPNGAGNIPELVLDATQAGAGTGLLSQATLILRLNTRGGVAPAGTCTLDTKASVVYNADYMFLG